MKQLLIIALIFSSYSVMAQNTPFHYKYRMGEPVIVLSDSLKKWSVSSNKLRTPAPGIYQLPIDRMPCIVPDTRSIAPIPNIWKSPMVIPYKGNIPNPALPKTFSPERKG